MELLNKNNIQDIKWFEDLFRTHFVPLCQFAMKFTGNNLDDAKEIVHEVFINVWEKMNAFPTDMNYKSYLYTSVNNRGLNFIRDRKKLVQLDQVSEEKYSSSLAEMEEKELERSIELAIHSLPDKCREVFELSRYDGLTYKSIAEKLAISVKTVEAQISKALRLMRDHLAEFLSLIILYLITRPE